MLKELELGSYEFFDDLFSMVQILELFCYFDNIVYGNMVCVVWELMGDGKKIILLVDNYILLWDLQESLSQVVLVSLVFLEGKG